MPGCDKKVLYSASSSAQGMRSFETGSAVFALNFDRQGVSLALL